jgi:hypothetical protein
MEWLARLEGTHDVSLTDPEPFDGIAIEQGHGSTTEL